MSHDVPNRNWSYPTAIKFGVGRIGELADHAAGAGLKKPLLVTDKALAALPITAAALDVLEKAGLGRAVFSDVDPNPNEKNMEDGIAVYKAGGHDGVICFGGGSALDLGKMIALMAGQKKGLSVWDLEDVDDWYTRADAAKIAPIIAVPTTAGTGSEVGRAGVLTNSATHKKKIIFHPKLMPAVTICDPALTTGMPKFITAGTGMDALAHCMETYMAPAINPPAEAIALDGLDKAWRFIERAVSDGSDREARWNMMMASMEGAMCFQKGLGAVHALSHPSGGLKGLRLHHGTLNAVYLPPVLRFNGPALGAEKIARMAVILGCAPTAAALAEAIAAMNARIGIPSGLGAMGVGADRHEAIADGALGDHCHLTTPRQPTRDEYLGLIAEAA